MTIESKGFEPWVLKGNPDANDHIPKRGYLPESVYFLKVEDIVELLDLPGEGVIRAHVDESLRMTIVMLDPDQYVREPGSDPHGKDLPKRVDKG